MPSFRIVRPIPVIAIAAAVLFAGGANVLSPRVADAAGDALSVAEIEASLNAPGAHDVFLPEAPFGLTVSEFYIPKDNPLTPAKVELGRQLYFDPRLSRDNTVSCATCHHPAKGWTDNAPVSTGVDGQKGGRNAPTVMNRLFSTAQFWDGRAASLEEQALGPIANPIEMGFTVEQSVDRLNAIPGYALQFERVFGGPATADRVAKAITAFERTVLAGGSPNDYYEALEFDLGWEPEEGEDQEDRVRREMLRAAYDEIPLSDAAKRGRAVYFGKARCDKCHLGQNLTDEQFHNIGVGMNKAHFDVGREEVTKDEKDRGAFKTPGLRNIADTAPYMHDGSQATLMEVVQFYNQGGHKNEWLSGKIEPLGLTQQEMEDLVAFMEDGLSGTITPVEEPRLPE